MLKITNDNGEKVTIQLTAAELVAALRDRAKLCSEDAEDYKDSELERLAVYHKVAEAQATALYNAADQIEEHLG